MQRAIVVLQKQCRLKVGAGKAELDWEELESLDTRAASHCTAWYCCQWRICTRAFARASKTSLIIIIHKPIMIFRIDLTIKAEEKVFRL